jgi:hypothetical protein
MHVTIHHPRHDELSSRVDHPYIAAARRNCRHRADGRDALIFDTHDATTNDLAMNRIEDNTADDLHLGHGRLLILYAAARMFRR